MSSVFFLQNSANHSNTVDPRLFGTNYLFHRQDIEKFETLQDMVELTGARYPGGSITEQHFDINNPDSVPDTFPESDIERFTPISEFLASCNSNGLNPTIVIPTSKAINSDGQLHSSYFEQVKDFVLKVMNRFGEGKEFPNIKIEAFEIGNEYWGSGGMTAAEYGEVSDKMSIAIQDALDMYYEGTENASEPNILIQMGNPVRGGADFEEGGVFHDLQPGSERARELGLTERDFDENGNLRWLPKVRIANEQIIDELSPEAREAIDGLVEHYYYRQSSGLNPSLEFNEHSTNFIELQASHWRAEGFDDPIFITEWNLSLFDYTNFGQVGAGTLIAQMTHMIKMGVEGAFVWPLQHNTPNDLAGSFDGDPVLTPIGAAFHHMAEHLPGLKLENEKFGENDVKLISYGNDQKSVDYVISRSTEPTEASITFDEFIGKETVVTIRRLYIESDNRHWEPGKGFVDVEGYRDHNAVSNISQETITIGPSGAINLTLRPFEIIVIESETGGASNEIIGSDGDDSLIGTSINDLMDGGSGNDTLWGADGHDTLIGAAGDDLLAGGAGNDSLLGGVGDDRLWGGEGNDIASGGDGNDLLNGGAGEDSLRGDRGNDQIDAGSGNDSVNGGDGNDTLWGAAGYDTLIGDTGDDLLAGWKGNDSLLGGAGNDKLWGGEGNDFVSGGDGHDYLNGGAGEDSLRGDRGNDHIDAGSGNDSVKGGDGNDTLWGAAGHDTLIGDTGDDLLAGWKGNDSLLGGGGNDKLWGGEGNDLVSGGDGHDYLNGGAGNDSIWGNEGDDQIYGGNGDDRIGAAAGNDSVFGGGGSDTVWGAAGNDFLVGEAGNDQLVGGDGADTLLGGDGKDLLWGGEGDDILEGGDGRDILNGGRGNDWLIAKGGNDWLVGGEGADTFVFQDPSLNRGDIRDFSAAEGDIIKISASLLNENIRDKEISEILAEIFHVGGSYGATLRPGASETEIYIKGVFSLDELLKSVVIIEDEIQAEEDFLVI